MSNLERITRERDEAIEARDFAERKHEEACEALEKHCGTCPRIEALEAALKLADKLSTEIVCLSPFEFQVRIAIGNTNYNVLLTKRAGYLEARAALESGQGRER